MVVHFSGRKDIGRTGKHAEAGDRVYVVASSNFTETCGIKLQLDICIDVHPPQKFHFKILQESYKSKIILTNNQRSRSGWCGTDIRPSLFAPAVAALVS